MYLLIFTLKEVFMKVSSFNSWAKKPKPIPSAVSVQDVLQRRISSGKFSSICNGGCAECGAAGCDTGGSTSCSGCGACGNL